MLLCLRCRDCVDVRIRCRRVKLTYPICSISIGDIARKEGMYLIKCISTLMYQLQFEAGQARHGRKGLSLLKDTEHV